MPKTVLPSKFQEWKGLDQISLIVHEMNCIFREITKDDFGIDGEIEVVEEKPDGKGFQTTGGFIKVQAKSGMSYVKQDTTTTFSSPVSKDDLETWYKSNIPTVFIVYHPQDGKLYWKEIKSYIEGTPLVWQPPFRIEFDKASDEFTKDCFNSIRTLAPESQTTRISFSSQERLISNLLKIRRLPKVWSAPTKLKHYDDVRYTIQGFVPPYNLVANRIYSFSNLYDKDCVLRRFCDTEKIRDENLKSWWGDEVLKRNYIFMLNQLLGIHLRRCGIRYNKQFKRNYFPRGNMSDNEFNTSWRNIRTQRTAPPRITAKHYTYGYDTFWRHLAADISFCQIAETWYLQVVPKYFFTIDGIVPWDSEKVGKYTTPIKAQEKNYHVLNHVLFWSDILGRSKRGSTNQHVIEVELDTHTVMVIEKMPMLGIAKFSIPFDPAIFEETPSSSQLNFWDLLPDSEGIDDDEI